MGSAKVNRTKAFNNTIILGYCSQARKIVASFFNCSAFNALLILHLWIKCACMQGCHQFCSKLFHYLPVANGQVPTLYSVQNCSKLLSFFLLQISFWLFSCTQAVQTI